MKLTEKQIDAAVEWWKNAVTGAVKKQMVRPGGGERSASTDLCEVMGIMLAAKTAPSEVEAEEFAQALRLHLSQDNVYHCLGVDYGPDKALRDCADAAGLSHDRFPWKTVMWFGDEGDVRVRHGYGEEVQTLVAAKETA